MLSGISGFHSYYGMYPYSGSVHGRGALRAVQAQGTAPASDPAAVRQSASAPARVPVQPVRPVRADEAGEGQSFHDRLLSRQGMDPTELSVRMRIQYDEPALSLPGEKNEDAPGIESVQEAAEKGKCQTCEKRKYQDGSDDMGVSFQTPTHIAPESAASRVRGHEMEHVVREQAKAEREDREVVSQSVTLHTSVCPECGKVYVSGGNTRTVTAAKREPSVPEPETGERRPFSAIA